MFKKHEDGTYSFSGRFWTQAVILVLLICAIGVNTQRTADKTERLNRETVAYAQQTNDCLSLLTSALAQRAEATKMLDALVDARSGVIDRRAQLWSKFIIDLSSISTELPQSQRDILAKPIIDQFIKDSAVIEADNEKINVQRRQVLEERARHPFPDPTCPNKLPGQ